MLAMDRTAGGEWAAIRFRMGEVVAFRLTEGDRASYLVLSDGLGIRWEPDDDVILDVDNGSAESAWFVRGRTCEWTQVPLESVDDWKSREDLR